MGLTQSINISTQAMAASQVGITTVANNIANVNTEGYSKQRVNYADAVNYTPLTNDAASIADTYSGVRVASITRYSDFYLSNYFWQENSTLNYLDQYAQAATNLEDLVNELNDTGLSNALDSFYTAADALNNTPSDLTARQNYVSSAESLCKVFNDVSSNLKSLQTTMIGTSTDVYPSTMSDQITEVNSILEDLAEINESIVRTNCDGNSSSTLLDSRDALITKLSNYMNINVQQNNNNTVTISVDNTALVKASEVKGTLKAENSLDAQGNIITTISVIDPETNNTVNANLNNQLKSGSITAILDFCGTDASKMTIGSVQNQINTLAKEFAATMNTLQTQVIDGKTPLCITVDAQGTKTLTKSTETMFIANDGNISTPINAANISINSAITNDPYQVAAARIDITANPNYAKSIGDNTNSTAIIQTRSQKIAGLDSSTFEGYMANVASKVGYATEDIDTKFTTETTVVQGIQKRLAAATGVNLDEELADLIKYQQAYKAAGRVFTACNDLIDVLLALGQ